MGKHKVGARQELRFETSRKKVGGLEGDGLGSRADVLRVVSGSAEVFGVMLVPGVGYLLQPGQGYAVFSWFGCEVELDESFCKEVYCIEEETMYQVAKIHANLEIMREKAKASASADGPRVAVVGAPNCGKSSLARTLAAYALRQGRKPLYVDVDTSKNSVGIPGCVGASALESPNDLVGEIGELGFAARRPLCYFVGTDKASESTNRLKEQTSLLAADLDAREKEDPSIRASGLVIDTFSWSSTPSTHNTLITLLKTLRANVIIVIGNDRLFRLFTEVFEKEKVVVVKVAKSGGIVESDSGALKRQQSERMRTYFYGLLHQLTPAVKTVKLGTDVLVYLHIKEVQLDDALRPIGVESTAEEESRVPQLTVVDQQVVGTILAILNCSDEKDVHSSNVAGFAQVQSVSVADNTLTLYVPCPGEMASKFLVHSKIKYMDIA